MTRRNIIRFIFSFIIGAFLIFKFDATAYAAAQHSCNMVTRANDLNSMDLSEDIPYGYYYLSSDLEVSDTLKFIGNDVSILCLNGHVLKGNGSSAVLNLSTNTNFKLCDCQTNTPHKFRVENEIWTLDEANGTEIIYGGVITNGGGDKGAVFIDKDSTLWAPVKINIVGNRCSGIYSEGRIDMTLGVIKGNGKPGATQGGGLYFTSTPNSSGTNNFGTITNTTFSDNIGKDGAGIYSLGRLELKNIQVTNNHATENGGGIYVAAGSDTRLIGGTYKNNRVDATGNGGGVYVNGSVGLSGSLDISDNTKDGNANNIYLPNGSLISPTDYYENLSTTTPIGVSSEVVPTPEATTVRLGYYGSTSYGHHFVSEDPAYILCNYNNYITLAKPSVVRVAYQNEPCTVYANGESINNSSNSLIGLNDGTRITVVPSTKVGYELASVSYYNGSTETIIENNNGYSFDLHDENVIIKTTYNKLFYIHFNNNDGRGSMETASTTNAQYYLPACTFLPKGNTEFAGWGLDRDGIVKITDPYVYLAGDDITIYALWKIHSHTFIDKELPNGAIKTSCKCGYQLIRYK